MPNITELRQTYPQYNDMSDQEFADAFHNKFYADMPKDQFYDKIGYKGSDQPKEDQSAGNTATGIIEAGLNLATGLTGGNIGMAYGGIKQAAKEALNGQFGTPEAANRIEQSAMQSSQDLTYQPRFQTGKDLSENIGKALNELIPIMPMAEFGMLHQGAGDYWQTVKPTKSSGKPVSAKVSALDEIAPKSEPVKLTAGEAPAPIDPQYLAERRAQERQQQIMEDQRAQAQAEAQGISADAFESARQDREKQSQELMDKTANEQAEQSRIQDMIDQAEKENHDRLLQQEQERRLVSTGEDTTGSGKEPQRTMEPTPEGPFGSLGNGAGVEQPLPESLNLGSDKPGGEIINRKLAPGTESYESDSNKFSQYAKQQKELDGLTRDLDLAQQKGQAQQNAVMKGSSATVRKVPRSQRGALNIDAIAKALGAKRSPKEPWQDIPGHEDTKWLATYRDPNDVLADVKAGLASIGDKWSKWENFRSGSSMKYIETGHPVIKAAADYMQAAFQRADHAITTIVKPVEHELQKMGWKNKQDIIDLAQLMKKEMFERRTFTPEQMAQAGFTDHQIKSYSMLRDAYDKAWSAQNDVLKQKGLPELSKHEYYLSSRWSGDWRSNVYDTNGRLIWVVKDQSKKGVERALDHLESQGVPIDRSRSEVEYARNSHATPVDLPAGYSSMIKHLGETNPISQKIREIMDAKMMDTAQKTLGQSKHFENKANIRGFVGDRPWMDPYHDARDMFHEQLNYLKNSFQWSEFNKAADKVKTVLNDPDVAAQAPNATKQANHIVDHYLGGNKVFDKLEQAIAKQFGTSTTEVNNAVNLGKTAWILQKMGTNLGAVVQNVIQMVNTIPQHIVMSEEGIKQNPIKTFLASTNDTLAGMASHYGKSLGLKSPAEKALTPLGRDALKYAEANGILNLSSFDEHTNVNSSQTQVAVQRTLGAPIQIADKFSKFAAFISFVHHLDQAHPEMNKMELFREAHHYMNATMVDPRMQERPFIVQDSGMLGSAAATLQSYTMNYLNQAHLYGTRAFKEGKPSALLAFLGISGAMSGLAGMTGLNYAVSGYDNLRDWIAKTKPEWYDKMPDIERQLLVDVGEGMGKTGEAIKYGIPSALSGADLSKKFETTLSAPVYGPVSDVAQQVGKVASGLIQGDKQGLAQAAYAVAPLGVGQGVLDVDSGAFQDPKTGKYAPPSSGNFKNGYFRTDTDKLMKRLGMTSISESRQKEIIYQRAKAEANDKVVNDGLAKKYVESIAEGDGDKGKNGYIANLTRRAPDQAQSLIQSAFQTYVKDHNLNAQQIAALGAKHLQAIQNYQKFYGGNNGAKQ